jgi:hypothetical protein
MACNWSAPMARCRISSAPYHDPADRYRAADDPIHRSAAANRSGGQPDPEPGTRERT